MGKEDKTLSQPRDLSAGPVGAGRSARAAEFLRNVAFALLLGCVAGRAFVGELPFRTNPVNISGLLAQLGTDDDTPLGVDNKELARTGFAVLLLLVVLLWLLAGGIGHDLRVRCSTVGVLILCFAGWSFASAWGAADRQSAWIVWLEQVSLLAAGFVAIQLSRNRRRFVMLVVVLAAVGVTLAAKGMAQLAWENADNVGYFEAYRDKMLTAQGVAPGSPEEKALIDRYRDTSLKGYFSLANLFAAEMLILLAAAVGLGGGKVIYVRYRRKVDGPLPKGEISAPAVAGVVTLLAIIPMALVFLLTRSRGAIGAACIVAVATAVLWGFRKRLAERWRAVVLAVLVIFVLGAAGVVGFGLAKDRLPSKTLTMRWFYWTGAAKIVKEHPYLGVGPGNFPHAYLRVRRPEAEEAVKTPHNFLAHAATQYGLPGGALYVAILASLLVLAWRAEKNRQSPTSNRQSKNERSPKRLAVSTLVFVAAAVGLSRWYFEGGRESEALLIVDCIIPACVLAVALALMSWFGGRIDDLPASAFRAMRIALAAGAAGFVIHNLVTFSLWTPGTATLFWVAVGAAAAQGPGRERKSPSLVTYILLYLVLVVIVISCMVLIVPSYRRLALTETMARSLRAGDTESAIAAAEKAAFTDLFSDATLYMNAARLSLLTSSPDDSEKRKKALIDASFFVIMATGGNKHNSGVWRLVGQIHRELGRYDKGFFDFAVEDFSHAVELDPSNARVRVEFAGVLLDAGKKREAGEQIDKAEEINRRLERFDPTSTWRFGAAEKEVIKQLREKAKQ
ncbi:MAG TPA: hypothetical protein ENH84_01295 [Phycisphaerae bacterium]|nr:hypothetical protein [Phycisphaerae bacterium]